MRVMVMAILDEMAIERKEDAFWNGFLAGATFARYREPSMTEYVGVQDQARELMLQSERATMAEVFNEEMASGASEMLEKSQGNTWEETWNDTNDVWILAKKLSEGMEAPE